MDWRVCLEIVLAGWIGCAYILGKAHGIRYAARELGYQSELGESAADLGVRDGKNTR